MYPHSWFCPYPTPGVAPRPDVSTGLGTQRKGFGSFAGIPGVKPPKPPMMSEPFLALALPFSKNCSKAIRESDFYRDSVAIGRSEEHTSELQSLMRISYAVFCLTKKTHSTLQNNSNNTHNTNKHK